MENQLTKISPTQKALQKILQSDTVPARLVESVDLLKTKNFKALSESMPTSLAQAVDQGLPMVIVSKAAAKEIIAFIEFELIKLSTMVNIDARLNLQRHQIPMIAESLFEDFKIESMEDISLCLRRGAMGKYSPEGIFRLDGAVISQWMGMYLEEKYQAVENSIAKGREQQQPTKTEGMKSLVDLYKAVVGDHTIDETYAKANAYERYKLDNPWKYYQVENLKIYARSQEHAEKIVQAMIESGEIERVENEDAK